jgi:hypothetical protein
LRAFIRQGNLRIGDPVAGFTSHFVVDRARAVSRPREVLMREALGFIKEGIFAWIIPRAVVSILSILRVN